MQCVSVKMRFHSFTDEVSKVELLALGPDDQLEQQLI